MDIINKIYYLLTPYERRNAFFLLLLILIVALLEMIGVASIFPFVTVLSNPNLIETNSILNTVFKKSSIIGIDNNQDFLFSLGILVFILLLTSIGFKALLTYAQIRFTQTLQYSLSKRLVERYLGQSYSWFLNQHSADLAKGILSEIGGLIANGISPLIELIAKGTITVTILILLIMVDPKVALIAGCSLSISYLVIFKLSKNYVNKLGKERLKNNQLLFKSVNEAFSALKEIKIGNLEQFYIGRFSNPAKIITKNMATSSIINALPRYAIEAVAFGGIILLILYQMAQSGSFISALPIISLYAFAGYRLIPAIQQIYGSISKLIFISPSLNRIYNDFENLKISNLKQHQKTVSFNKSINLKNICFSYPNASKTTLKNISLSIPINTTVGIVGSTGSGKTTTVDIILGLLLAEKGTVEIDNKIINKEDLRSWQHFIGYVPQYIFLSDDTIAANIALGTEPREINIKAIEKVAKIANLHEFVTSELPNQYHTMIGERGVRLSGGQRQRIGIARALYHNPKVLILDEATSALDNQTEKAVMDAVNNLSKEITIILIAHRLSTVKKCDKIFLLEKGQLKNEGTFEELIQKDENFRNMVNT